MDCIHSRIFGRVGGTSIYGETFTRQQGILRQVIGCRGRDGAAETRKTSEKISWVAGVAERVSGRERTCQALV